MAAISERGIEFIARFEGFREDWYPCSANVWTIGYGHAEAHRDGRVTDEDLPPGFQAPLSEDEAAERLRLELDGYDEVADRPLTG